MDYRDNRQRWAESHQVVHFYAGQWCTFTPALTQGYGVLRRAVPTWLNQPPNRARIIAVHDAQPRDGGSGALYLLLRKRR